MKATHRCASSPAPTTPSLVVEPYCVNTLWKLFVQHPEVIAVGVICPVLALRWNFVPEDRKRTELFLVWNLLLIPIEGLIDGVLFVLSYLCPWKYDLYIYRLDQPFGQPSFWIGRHVGAHQWSVDLVNLSYNVLFPFVICTLGVYLWRRTYEETMWVVKLFVVNMVAALGFYCIVPVCGPKYAFASFPFLPLASVAAQPLAINATPNGIPSVHMSTALLLFWCLRHWRLGSVVGGVFVGLTMLATLGTGNHYIFDLVCAVPYTAGILWVMRSGTRTAPAEEMETTATV